DQWLRRPGYPELRVDWSYDSAAREVAISVTQSGRFGVYRLPPITVAVVDSAGVGHRVRVQPRTDAGAVTVRVPLAGQPGAVVLDPDVELLAALNVVHVER